MNRKVKKNNNFMFNSYFLTFAYNSKTIADICNPFVAL